MESESQEDRVMCIVREGPMSSKGERQYVFRYADGVESTHREKTRRLTSQVDGVEIQRTSQETAAVRKAIAEWKLQYPDDCPEVKQRKAALLQKSRFWVRCSACGKNRKMPPGVKKSQVIPVRRWRCSSSLDPLRNNCDAAEEPEDTRICRHAEHERWHPLVARQQPVSAFYGRLRVCALCHRKRSRAANKRQVEAAPSSLILHTKRTRKPVRAAPVFDDEMDSDFDVVQPEPKRTRADADATHLAGLEVLLSALEHDGTSSA